MRIRLKKRYVALLFICVLSFCSWDRSTLFAVTVYYDAQGNIISEDQYRKLKEQPQAKGNEPASAEVSTEAVESPPAEAVQPEEKQSIQSPPVVNEFPDPVGVSSDGEVPLAGEQVSEEPNTPQGKSEAAPPSVTETPAPAEVAADAGVSPAAEKESEKPISQEEQPDAAAISSSQQSEPDEEPEKEPLYAVSIDSKSLFRSFQRDTQKKDNANVLPLYEYLRIDVDNLKEGLSLHTYGWGRYDFGESEFYHDNPEGELLYGYLEYNRPDYGLNFKLGRQHVFEGIINSSIDGLGIKGALPYFNYSLYGGLPVALSSENGRSGDSFLGGRIAGHIDSRYEIGLSYRMENSNSEKDGEMVGGDIYIALPKDAFLQGQSSYNLDTRGWAQHFYEAGLDIADLHVRPVYERYQYNDFFNSKDNSADPFRFLAGTDEILTVVGGDLILKSFATLDLGAKISHYGYDQRNDDALYYEANLTWYLNGLSQVGGQFGRMDGKTNETSYFLSRAFFYWNPALVSFPLGFVTGDIVYVYYDEEIYGQDRSLFVSLGAGDKFFDDHLEVKLSGDYSSDPYFDSDLRVMLTIIFQREIQ